MKLLNTLIAGTILVGSTSITATAQEKVGAFVFEGDAATIASQWRTLETLQPNPDAQVSWGLVTADNTPKTALAIAEKYCPQCSGEIQGQLPPIPPACKTSDGSYFIPKISSFSTLGSVIERIGDSGENMVAGLSIGSVGAPPSQQEQIPSAPQGCW